jgi:hypothetical protein
MSADVLLARLDGVRRGSQPDVWRAKCPAHDSRGASLAIRELGDGRVLLRCFAECATADVLAAVGLTFTDLYPERPIGDRMSPERRPFPARDVLACIANEALIVAVVAQEFARGKALSDQDHERLTRAVSRLQRAAEIANVR